MWEGPPNTEHSLGPAVPRTPGGAWYTDPVPAADFQPESPAVHRLWSQFVESMSPVEEVTFAKSLPHTMQGSGRATPPLPPNTAGDKSCGSPLFPFQACKGLIFSPQSLEVR